MTTTGADSRTCEVTAVSGSFTGSPLTMTIPDGQTSITSGPIFSSGTQVSVDGFLTVTSTNIAWDSDAQTITMDSDKEATLTLTETGPRKYSITCSISISGVDLTSGTTTGNSAGCSVIYLTTFTFTSITIPAGSDSASSSDVYVNGLYSIFAEATIQGTEYVTNGGPVTKTISGSDLNVAFTLIPK